MLRRVSYGGGGGWGGGIFDLFFGTSQVCREVSSELRSRLASPGDTLTRHKSINLQNSSYSFSRCFIYFGDAAEKQGGGGGMEEAAAETALWQDRAPGDHSFAWDDEVPTQE